MKMRIHAWIPDQVRNDRKKGFTLVEALVAVSILTIAIAAPLAVISENISRSSNIRDEITAIFLTQEVFEVIRHLRDNDSLLNAGAATWTPAGLGSCIAAYGQTTPVCYLDAPTRTLYVCPSGVCTNASHAVTYHSGTGLYQNTGSIPGGAVQTKFLRTFQIRRAPAPADNRELWITAQTTWSNPAVRTAANAPIIQSFSATSTLMRD